MIFLCLNVISLLWFLVPLMHSQNEHGKGPKVKCNVTGKQWTH